MYKDNESNILNTKLEIIHTLKAEIIGLSETCLLNKESIEVIDYQWFGMNRQGINISARRGSGGVGFLIKTELLNYFTFEIVDTSYQGILWGKLCSKSSDFGLLVAECYQLPDRLIWADSDAFFNTLTSHVHQYQNEGFMVIGGDFNAHCGNNVTTLKGQMMSHHERS